MLPQATMLKALDGKVSEAMVILVRILMARRT
jgi:hypothetical protein